MGLTNINCKECDKYLNLFLIAAGIALLGLLIFLIFSIRTIVKIILGKKGSDYE